MRILTVVALLLGVIVNAIATIHFVTPGTPIQPIVDTSAPGDTVLLEEGTHVASVVFHGRNLVVGSAYLLDGDTSHVTATVVEPDPNVPDTNSCFVYAYGEDTGSRLAGLTLRYGHGTYWDWIQGRAGGGVFIVTNQTNYATVSIEWCRFEACRAGQGGGLCAYGGQYHMGVNLTVQDCSFHGCKAGEPDVQSSGGGIFGHFCRLVVRRTVFSQDTADAWGGALEGWSSEVNIDSCQITECVGYDAVLDLSGGSGRVANCYFAANRNVWSVGQVHLNLSNSAVDVTGCHFEAGFGGTPLVGLWGQQMYSFVGNLIENHTTVLITGTVVVSSFQGEVAYNIIRDNTNVTGGAFYVLEPNEHAPMAAHIHHNVLTGNSSGVGNEPSVLKASGGRPSMDSNWISGNTGPTMDFMFDAPTLIDARDNWWGDSTGPYHPVLNPGGHGDTLLSDSVLFVPWLTSQPDTSLPQSIGHKPYHIPASWQLVDIFPNPFNASLSLILAGFAGQDFDISLYNLLGQQVDVVHRGAATGGQVHYQAPLWLASGVYLLSARDKHSVQTKKVVLMK